MNNNDPLMLLLIGPQIGEEMRIIITMIVPLVLSIY